MNLFCKPYEQNQACLNYAMAKESCVKASYKTWVFPREQMSKAILSVLWHGEKSCAKAGYDACFFFREQMSKAILSVLWHGGGKLRVGEVVSAVVFVGAMDDG